MSQIPSDESPDKNYVFPFIIYSITEYRGQRQFCTNLFANVLEQGISPCKAEIPEAKIKRQIIDHYLKGICNLTQPYGIYTIEFSTENQYHSQQISNSTRLNIGKLWKNVTFPSSHENNETTQNLKQTI